ncbi:vacuolar protein sorting-associated protein 13 [Guyanagaster necrorhizus]|uniref:Vacuolar protein sorting-associated protein 13 n=1 Tax=Guyanagaster necrorhizus TaxID=856835 RepID=A0A9P7W0V4_9AGAR|nr:vacuolar protein sorting-associated protein 13 [Guyanagaster necrorhizus MCA 3950]KAG7450519.1 vacuolar protein sorting-associated protein 13 [Guyanagaster necrorhizus MCA 3950]
MWWMNPGKEVLNVLFNRILAPYVENMDMNQVNYGIGQGQLTLTNLRMKKGALDKFRLPVDVLEGHLGKFTLSLHWMNLGNQPVEVLVEDVYILVVPSTQSSYDPEEEEERMQAAKAERLQNAELLHMRGQAETSSDSSPQNQGLWQSLMAKVINNLQVTVKNIHIRYEDKLSVPGHPFAAGLTLAGFEAVSVNEEWQPSFIESTAGAIHKLANLQSLAVYFDTDSLSIAGLPPNESIQKFHDMIASGTQTAEHQFILKPVSGEGRVVVNHKVDNHTPRFDLQLLFGEIGVALDDHQYRDVISLLDMYHVYIRQHQYRKYRPGDEEFSINTASARLHFAGIAILEEVREKNRKWTWAYFAERRGDRNKYVDLFQRKQLGALPLIDQKDLDALERKLSYEDIRFYRSIARSRLRKDTALRKRLEEDKTKQQPTKQSWSNWLWGSSEDTKQEDPAFGGPMTDEQRQQLYEVLDYDEKSAVIEALEAPRDSLKARLSARLNKGSFVLRTDPHGTSDEIISVVFDVFRANAIQRADNLEASVSLGGFGVFDGTTRGTLHHQIVSVKDIPSPRDEQDQDDSFLSVKFEHKPLDERADNALTVRMRHMEIVYHKGYVEAIYKFFKPPESQLESVEALLNAASQTLEGLSKETRAGLEFALQNHKTIDIQMDMNAPVIIIPEDVTTKSCKHLLIDAGHIAIESDLADKEAIRVVHLKRNQQYSDEDHKRLESLMYDKVSLKLKDAQFILGNDLESCRRALTSESNNALHLVERINVDLQVQNSIVPSVLSLSRFKVSGNLPTLQVNLSDTKYKSLMRLIDVCIPKFGDDDTPLAPDHATAKFPLAPGLFSQGEQEYNLEDDAEGDDAGVSRDEFYEASDEFRPDIHQHIFDFDFRVDELKVHLYKATADNVEKALGNVSLDKFSLIFASTKYDMKVDVNLRALSMDLVQPDADSIKFMSSLELESSQDKDLLSVTYTRIRQQSPQFFSVYDGVEQKVDVRISTFIFRAAPEPVVSLYDFIVTTFVPHSIDQMGAQSVHSGALGTGASKSSNAEGGKIHVAVKLASVQVVLVNGHASLATLSLSTADVDVLLRPKTLRVSGRLGSLSLSNDSELYAVRPEFDQIMSIEGQNFAEFLYETYDPDAEAYNGVKTFVDLKAASVKLHFLEMPLHDIYLFLVKLAKLKGLYDAATQAAVQSAPEIERMRFDISIKSPIVVFPSDANHSRDALVLRLGEISARSSETEPNRFTTGLRGIQLVSNIYSGGELSGLKIIDDTDVTADVAQAISVDRSHAFDQPDTQVVVKISDVRLHLTQVQYGILIRLSQAIPRVLAGAPEGYAEAESVASASPFPDATGDSRQTLVQLGPELRIVSFAERRNWTTIDLVVAVDTVKLHLYDELATTAAKLKEHGIARFALNRSELRYKILSDGSGEVQVVLKSFTMSNTRPGNTKFREIIPAAQHDRNQFMILYTMAGGSKGPSLAILTIDSPQIIFAVDPVFRLINFFTSAFDLSDVEKQTVIPTPDSLERESTNQSSLDFRVDLHNVSVNVLENDADADTQSIKLTIKQIMLSQQGVLALTINRLGMSLMSMGKDSETVRFLDDVDMTFSLDGRSTMSQQMTSIEVNAKPIVFRASYRDIKLITTIINKAIELHGNSRSDSTPNRVFGSQSIADRSDNYVSKGSSKSATRTRAYPVGKARISMSKEQLKGSFDGFRLVLIGDMHEQPMLHLKVKRFIVGAKDWSGALHATTTMTTHISYWNLTNSHWEPLIDPWTFTIIASKEDAVSGINIGLSARERLDLNLSTTFAELAITTANMWSEEGERVLQRARGSYAPYRIRNRTGSTILAWSEVTSRGSHDGESIKILNEETKDWRFDDWKALREHVASSGQHCIGVQVVGTPWERIGSIPVDREGEFTFPLKPPTEKLVNRLLCEVKVIDNVKVVTIRSTYKIENHTLYPLEVTLVDDHGQPVHSLEKIVPGQDYAIPIDAVVSHRIRIQPDQGFGYKWCPAIRWEDLILTKSFTVRCPHSDPREAAFRFQACVDTDFRDSGLRKYPKINLKLRAPLELENLLPYNLQYRVYDKDTDQNWRSYLRKGGIMPVHSVELGHLVLLNVDIEDSVFEQSEFAIINTDENSDFDVEKRLSLKDPKGRKLTLKLNYVRYPDSGGAFKVQIYSPYVVVNKTGLPFAIRSVRSTRSQDVAGDDRQEELKKPVPFLLSHQAGNGHEFCLKLGESAWSKHFSVEAPAAETALVVASQTSKLDELHVGLSWGEGLGKYKLTKVLTLAPRFLVTNKLSEPIVFRVHGVALGDRSTLSPDERCPLITLRASPEKLLTVAFPGLNAFWSPPINVEDIGSVHFRLRGPGGKSKDMRLIRTDVKLDGSTIFVSFASGDNEWPFLIENGSDSAFSFSQRDTRDDNRATKSNPAYTVAPHTSLPYAWDYPASRDKKITLAVNGSRRVIDIMEIGNLVPFKFNDGQRNRVVSLDVRADGQRQILRITNYNPEQSLYKPKNKSLSGSVLRQDTISSAEAFEAITEDIVPTFGFSINFAGIGISLVNRRLIEVIFVSMNTLSFNYTNSPVVQTVNISCGSLQIDNQLHDALYPVILQPTPMPKESNGVAPSPTVQASIIWLNDAEHGVLFIKYCSILLQALTIEADEDLLFSIYDLTQIQGASWEAGVDDVLIQDADVIPEPKGTTAGQELYFEVLELQPIKLSLSFMRTERVSSEEKLSIRNPLAVVLNALTMTVGNINDAPLEMNALAIKDMRLNFPELQSRITYHYRQDVLRQLYRILGSADFIGNPVGLFTNVSSGVADIFYEPFNGVVMHGNKELGIGLAKGAASFVKKTIFGVSDSMTKFTSSVGKGISVATFDSEYQARRRMTQRRNKPRHAIYGVTAGGEALATSVASAFEGVMKPYEGAESGGAYGFFKGVGKGVVGAVTKPVVGVFDLVSNVSAGVRNTTTVFDSPERDRVRLPRLVPSDGVLIPYSSRDAMGQYWMRDLNNGIYRKESYVAHFNSPGSDNVVLLTASRVLSFWSKRLRLDWDLPFTEVQGVTVEDTGIRFAHKAGKEHDKFVFIPEKSSQSWFFDRVAGVVRTFNLRRRMEG